jgi:hypothetical protein
MHRPTAVRTATAVFVFLLAPSAFAQSSPNAPPDPAAASAEPAPAPAPSAAPSPAEPAPAEDGGRFRFGINGTAGVESVSADNSDASLSGAMFGLDVRLGYQVMNLLAIYAEPHLSFGSLGTGAGGVPISGGTGTFIGTALAELTLIDRLFVAAGAGYGVLNNPSGLAFEARVGGYPIMVKSDKGPRRKGLMVGGTFRSVFVDGATGTLFMGCIGYEAF